MGWAGSIYEEVAFYNGEFEYTIYYAVDRIAADNPNVTGAISVTRGDEQVAQFDCDADSVSEADFYPLYEAKESGGPVLGPRQLYLGCLLGAMPQTVFEIATRGQGLYEFTRDLTGWVTAQEVTEGLLTLFIRHTSASLLIQENADPEVQSDLKAYFARLVPPSSDPSMSYLKHTYEGPDDMPAHIKATMMPVSLNIPVSDGRLALGTWQGIYVFEHRDRPHMRQVVGHLA